MNFPTFLILNLTQCGLISTGCKIACDCPSVGASLVVLGFAGLVANAVLFFSRTK